MKKKMKRLSKGIMTSVIAVAMMLGAVAIVVGVLAPARADDSEYNFTTEQLDPEWYAATYPEVAAAVGTDPLALFIHYAEHGIYEGRIPYAGAEPGAPINGYKEPAEEVAARAAAFAAEKARLAQAAAAARAQSIAAAQVGVGEYVYDYSAVYDLSDWTPEQLAMLAQKQLEFDASPYVKVGWTEQQVYERMILICDTMYPEGSIGGYCDSGSSKIVGALYGSDLDWLLLDEQGLLLCDKDGMRVMPVGYVECQTVRRANGGNIRDVRVGDMIYTNGSGTGHVQVVLSRDDKGITVVESNQNSDKKFHWGRHISWAELENGGNNIYQQQNKWSEYVHFLY